MIATFGEGYGIQHVIFGTTSQKNAALLTSSISTGTSRTKHQGRAMLKIIIVNPCPGSSKRFWSSQYSHSHGKPEILVTDEGHTIEIP